MRELKASKKEEKQTPEEKKEMNEKVQIYFDNVVTAIEECDDLDIMNSLILRLEELKTYYGMR